MGTGTYDDTWIERWRARLAPNTSWDQGGSTRLLTNYLSTTETDWLQGAVAYVPGCGRGYDVVELARYGCQVTGVDLSQDAVLEAQRTASTINQQDLKGSYKFRVGNFFEWHSDESWVDVGYDCTFLCALQPGCYESWAATWANIIKPGGILITYQYPLETVELGCKCPPWPLSKQLYSELLTAQGFENSYQTDTAEGIFTHRPGIAVKGHAGLEAFACWRKVPAV